MTRNLCAHPAQFLNPIIPKFCYSSYMVIISLYNSKILLSLHYFLTPQFQTFTNLLTGIFGVRNPTYFFFEIGRNYVSIIVNIIRNLLWIFVSIRRLLQLIVCIRVLTLPQKHHRFFFSFLPSPLLNLQTMQAPLFSRFNLPPKKKFFSCTPPPSP